MIRILLAEPRGFCAGVERAIEVVEKSLEKFGAPIFVRHEIVHNRHVVERLRAKGVVFVDELNQIPPGAVTIFSAHGVAKSVVAEARSRDLPFIDATCPLVTKVHSEGQRYAKQGREVILIGHPGHPEVEGTLGQIEGRVYLVASVADAEQLVVERPDALAYVTQTTLSVDDTREIIAVLNRRFPTIIGPDVRDICYATQNRQTSVRELALQAEVILVLGSNRSSNSNRLREIAEEQGARAYLLEDASELRPEWLEGASVVGITAGASAPEDLVLGLVAAIKELTRVEVATLPGPIESVHFKIPAALEG
ncbi:MAG: 4-hydroxy-3-methylbut-2-enyl diphosphate reductase [Candidatus Pacebacteria bacterium]|nr:4-hydroxy-3-methylbut-2-enyl diphosphate reductase [Candidatus Paceibacterota bacterium]